MTSLQDIIARLEAATGPDRELDEAIVLEVPITRDFLQLTKSGGFEVLHYTASIDHALTLVPKEWHIDLTSRPIFPRDFLCKVSEYHSNTAVFYRPYRGSGPTPAIALCIAALRARSRADAKGEK